MRGSSRVISWGGWGALPTRSSTRPGTLPVRLEDGKLYGRGAVDAKDAFCAAVAAASGLSKEVLERLTLTLIGAVEEEAPTSRGARHALATLPRPDFVIIGEPSGWEALTLGYKGRLVVGLELSKPNFHSAGEGSTAPEDVVALYGVAKRWADGLNEGVDGVFGAVQLSLQALSSSGDGLPAARGGDPRVAPAAPLASRRGRGGAARGAGGGEGLTLTFTGHERAYRSARDTPLTRAFRTAVRKARVRGVPASRSRRAPRT